MACSRAMRSKSSASAVAMGGVFAALAVIVMSLGTIIPVATYVCPVTCMLILQIVVKFVGARMGWAWYGAVAVLALLLAPDKEAAAVFACLGYYPIVKPKLDSRKWKWLWKALLFNGSILVLYWILLHLIGMEQLVSEFAGMGIAMTAVLLVLGNVTFILLDRLLGMRFGKRK